MKKVSIIIPVHNLVKRGLKRIRNSVISLQYQLDYIEDIIIVDSSERIEFEMLDGLLHGLKFKHIHYPLHEFNKCKLLNEGIKHANGYYVMATDGDYIFKADFLETCEHFRSEKRMLHKKVKMLPNMDIKKDKIRDWKFPKCGFNVWGQFANGACQYATKDFFINNPYPEEMDGFGAMDNMMFYIAVNNGLEVIWMDESEILHQHHPVVNKMGGSNRAKFDRNQQMLHDYKVANNLPDMLFKI